MQAEIAWGMGLIDTRQRHEAEALQQQVRPMRELMSSSADGSVVVQLGGVHVCLSCHPLLQIATLVRNKNWRKARVLSDELLGYITNASASATLEDIRRCAWKIKGARGGHHAALGAVADPFPG